MYEDNNRMKVVVVLVRRSIICSVLAGMFVTVSSPNVAEYSQIIKITTKVFFLVSLVLYHSSLQTAIKLSTDNAATVRNEVLFVRKEMT